VECNECLDNHYDLVGNSDLWVLRLCDGLGQFEEFPKRDLILVRSKRRRIDTTKRSSLDKPCGKALDTGLAGPVGAHVASLGHVLGYLTPNGER
jgi:hypothetical protein